MKTIIKILLACILSAVYFLYPFTAFASGIQTWRNYSCRKLFSVIRTKPATLISNQSSVKPSVKQDIENANTEIKDLIIVPFSAFKWPLYFGMKGLLRYATDYFEGDVTTAYNNMKYVLQDNKLWSFMGYKNFYGSVSQYYDMKSQITNKTKKLNKIFWNQSGLILLANIAYKGYLNKAYDSAVAIVGEKEVQSKGWKKFYGNIKEYEEHAMWIYYYTKKDKFVEPQAMGEVGLQKIANKLYNGDKNITYINVRAILDEKDFEQLKWNHFTPNEDTILLHWDFST